MQSYEALSGIYKRHATIFDALAARGGGAPERFRISFQAFTWSFEGARRRHNFPREPER